MPSPTAIDRTLSEWMDRDRQHAIHPPDHAVIESTTAARALVLELFEVPARARDLYSACARLGRLLAEGGGSPSLSASSVDEAAAALGSAGVAVDAARLASARAALVEGYFGAVREAELAALRATWAYPRCVVPIGPNVVAVACGYPADDAALLDDWAADVATRATKAKVRRAVLSGNERACAAVSSALGFVGIEVVAPSADVGSASGENADRTKTRWFRLPWQR